MKGKISISRWTSNVEPYTGIGIDVEDEMSGTRILRVEMTIEAFGQAITGLGSCPCEFQLSTKHAGKRREVKEEIVLYPRYTKKDEREINAALAPHEVDGWYGRNGDVGNMHRYVSGKSTETHDAFMVTFIRFVDTEAE